MDLSFLLEFAFVKYYSVWQDHLHNAPARSFSSLHLPALKKKKNEICNEWNFQSHSDFLPGRKLLSVRPFFPFLFRSQISSGHQSRGFKNMFFKKALSSTYIWIISSSAFLHFFECRNGAISFLLLLYEPFLLLLCRSIQNIITNFHQLKVKTCVDEKFYKN